MTGYFWKSRDANMFGAFTPSLGTGLYHVADEKISPGMKLWSYGVGEDQAWATLSTGQRKPYAEIQGGPIGDQSIKLELQPGQKRSHVEYWIPTDKTLDIYALKVPSLHLRAESAIPFFQWARANEVTVWSELQRAFEKKGIAPKPPEVEEFLWAPSGMEKLNSAFAWAIKNTQGENSDRWRFYFGAWLAGRGESEEAIGILSNCKLGVAKALLARLYKLKGDVNAALSAMKSIQEPWLQIHPQVVVEHDKLLRSKGINTLEERERLLSRVDALEDEWIVGVTIPDRQR